MDLVVLGKTGLTVNKNGFGALPVQRVSKKEAVYLLQKAFYNGINYFDTARVYSDSEEKLGAAFEYTRERIVISTKTAAQDAAGMRRDLEESLRRLGCRVVSVWGEKTPVVTFVSDRYSPEDIGDMLYGSFDIICRTGLHCAPLIFPFLAMPKQGTVRFSLSRFTTKEEVEQTVEALEAIFS